MTHMSTTPATSTAKPAGLESQRRRLLYQSLYTGTKETDLLLAAFARECLPTLDATGLASYEALLGLGDHVIWRLVAKNETPPPELDPTALNALLAFVKKQAK